MDCLPILLVLVPRPRVEVHSLRLAVWWRLEIANPFRRYSHSMVAGGLLLMS